MLLVQVLLTSPLVPEAQREQALNALAAACGVEAGAVQSTVTVIALDDALLLPSPPAAAKWPPLLGRRGGFRSLGSLRSDSDAMADINADAKMKGATSCLMSLLPLMFQRSVRG